MKNKKGAKKHPFCPKTSEKGPLFNFQCTFLDSFFEDFVKLLS